MLMKDLNKLLCIINRVVVKPKYRTIGLGVKLAKETLPLTGTTFVEMPAVMAKYNPFAEKRAPSC
jgi:ABC-type ATPase with predicted acetyltransferase domain